jgi:hypothetical protein
MWIFDAHPLKPSEENRTARCVLVSQQIPRCGAPREASVILVRQPEVLLLLDMVPIIFGAFMVVLVAFDVRLHMGRWHDSNFVPNLLKQTRPVMRIASQIDASVKSLKY